jgi:ABC-type multidrug transport system fused ATPase/permease subunit
LFSDGTSDPIDGDALLMMMIMMMIIIVVIVAVVVVAIVVLLLLSLLLMLLLLVIMRDDFCDRGMKKRIASRIWTFSICRGFKVQKYQSNSVFKRFLQRDTRNTKKKSACSVA